MEFVTALLSDVGFPIAIAIMMLWILKDMQAKHTDEIKNLSETYATERDKERAEHKEEVTKLTEVISACNVQMGSCVQATEAAVSTLREVKVVVENNNRLFDVIANNMKGD